MTVDTTCRCTYESTVVSDIADRVWKSILGILDLTKIWCGNLNLNEKQDFSATQEVGFTNI